MHLPPLKFRTVKLTNGICWYLLKYRFNFTFKANFSFYSLYKFPMLPFTQSNSIIVQSNFLVFCSQNLPQLSFSNTHSILRTTTPSIHHRLFSMLNLHSAILSHSPLHSLPHHLHPFLQPPNPY